MDSDKDDSDIISFRKLPRYTNIDYREKLSLHANDVLKLRVLASNYRYEEEFNHIIIALLSIMAILNLRAARQQLGTQRNDDVFLFNMSITESLDGSTLSSNSSITTITTILTNSTSKNSSMATTITDDSDTTITSKTTSDSDISMMS